MEKLNGISSRVNNYKIDIGHFRGLYRNLKTTKLVKIYILNISRTQKNLVHRTKNDALLPLMLVFKI